MNWWRGLWKRGQLEEELDAELRHHIEHQVQDDLRQGMSEPTARRQAKLGLGWFDQVKEACRDVRGTRWLYDLAQDLRFGIRGFGKRPGFTAAVLFIVALGIGAATAIFSVGNAVLLRPLPYPDADRLVSVVRLRLGGFALSHDSRTSALLHDHAMSFSALAVTRASPGLTLVSPQGAEYVRNLQVSSDYFRVLGVPPALGRDFTLQDEQDASTVILSHGLWIRHFGQSPNIVGQVVRLAGRPLTVIGVAAPSFQSFPPVDLWTVFPFRTDPQGEGFNYHLLARLPPGGTMNAAESELQALTPLLADQLSDPVRDPERVTLLPYQAVLGREVVPVLLLLSVVVGIFLLISGTNTAGLLVTRAAARRREFAVRAAIGGTGGRLARQLLTESLLLASVGGGLGVAVAAWGTNTLVSLQPSTAVWKVTADARVLLAALGLSLLVGVVFSMAPVVQARRASVALALHSGGDRVSGGWGVAMFRRSLVVGQVGLCTVLVVIAGLFLETLGDLTSVELGFNPSGVVTGQASLDESRYPNTAAVASFYGRTVEEFLRLPGVEHAAVTNNLPAAQGMNLPIHSPQRSAEQPIVSVDWRYVTDAYFKVMEIPLMDGRAFEAGDGPGRQPVAVVNEAFVRQVLGDTVGVGSQIQLYEFIPGVKDEPRTIVGIVGDVKSTLAEPSVPTMFVPIAQVPDAILATAHSFFQMNWVVRTRGANVPLIPRAEDIVRRTDPQLSVSGFRTMDQVIAETMGEQRFQAVVLVLFAVVALALAATGLYTVVASATAQRTREIGIRMALGGTTGGVRVRFVRDGLKLGVLGTALGLGAALLLTRVLQGLLLGVRPPDPQTLGGAAALLLAISVLAVYVPAWRATRADPMAVLRVE